MAYLQVGIDSVFETAARIGSTFRDTKGNDSKHFSLYTGQFNRRVYTSFFGLMNTPRIHLTMDPYYSGDGT